MTMWIAGVALLAGVLGLGFAWPVLRPREVRQQRLEARDVLAEEWQALDRRRADGELTAEQHQSLQAELGQRLLNETASPAPDRPADTAASGKRWLLLGGLTTLVLTGSLYWRTGRPDLALAPPQTARSAIGDDMVQKLAALGAPEFGFIQQQAGMFSYSGLSKAQVDRLRDEFGIYAVGTGRICVAALNRSNLDAVTKAIVQVL